MKRKRHTPEEIIGKPRNAEVQLANGASIAEVCKKLGISENTLHRWRGQGPRGAIPHPAQSRTAAQLIGVANTSRIRGRADSNGKAPRDFVASAPWKDEQKIKKQLTYALS